MREIRQSGSVRGVRLKPYPYRDPILPVQSTVSIRAKPLFSQIRLHVEVEACEMGERLLRDVVGARQRPRAWYGILSRAV